MKLFRGRRSREGVERRSMYPQPFSEERHPRLTFWYRFLLGRPMDGQRWTDSTFWRSATTGEDHWWLRLAGWHRVAVRITACWLLLLIAALTLLAHLGQWAAVAQLACAQLILLTPLMLLTDRWFRREYGVRVPVRREVVSEEGDVIGRSWKRWTVVTVREGRREWEREVVEPLAAVLAGKLDISHQRPAREWVSVPRDYATPGGHPVVIDLPSRFGGNEREQKALLQLIRPRLGLEDIEASWQLSGRHPRVLISAPPEPPRTALYADYAAALAAAPEFEPVLGVVADGSLVHAKMQDDSPHIALSAGSGAGKSKLTASRIAQALFHGWHVIIIDWKVESHEWAKGLPGVTYVSDVEDIHNVCVRIGQEVDMRRMLSPEMRMRRVRTLVVREEWNVTAQQLSTYWALLRAQNMRMPMEDREIMPARSPAITSMDTLDAAGRSFSMFDFLIAQRMSSRVFNGNTDARESFGLRLLSRYTMQTWKMLTSIRYIKKPSVLGRWVAIVNDEAQVFQAILGTDEQWRELAQSGKPNPTTAFGDNPYLETISSSDTAEALAANGNDCQLQRQPAAANGDVDLTLDDPLPITAASGSEIEATEILKLSDIPTRLGYLGVSERMLREWRDSEPDFPESRGGSRNQGYLYDLEEVRSWVMRHRAAQQARKVKG